MSAPVKVWLWCDEVRGSSVEHWMSLAADGTGSGACIRSGSDRPAIARSLGLAGAGYELAWSLPPAEVIARHAERLRAERAVT